MVPATGERGDSNPPARFPRKDTEDLLRSPFLASRSLT